MMKEFTRAQNFLGDSSVMVFGIPQNTICKHYHDFYELVFVKEGFCLHHLEDSVFLASEGDIFIIRPFWGQSKLDV